MDAQHLDGELVDDVHLYWVRVFYEDTDFSTNVYHAAYLKFMERARSGFLRLRGVHHSQLAKSDGEADATAFAVSELTAKYHATAHIDDVLEVKTSLVSLSGARIHLNQRITRDEQPILTGDVTLAVIDGTGRARRVPDVIKKALQR